MNFQKKPPDFVIKILKENNIKFFEIDYYAYPLLFNGTGGPCEGISLCSMATFTVEAYVVDGGRPVVFVCSGMYAIEHERIENLLGYRPEKWKKYDRD